MPDYGINARTTASKRHISNLWQ